MSQPTNETEEVLSTNEELRIGLHSLKSNKGWQHLEKNIRHWQNQCQAEISKQVKEGKLPATPLGEFEAYGRVLNAIDFFLIQLTGNPGEGPNLDPIPPVK